MRTLLFIFCSLVSPLSATAATLEPELPYYPADFYQRVQSGLHDEGLKGALFEILSQGHISGAGHDSLVSDCGSRPDCAQHSSLGYKAARQIMFGKIHLQQTPDGYAILDVYCEHLATKRDFRRQPPGPGKIPDPAVLNAEHTWPQSHFSQSFPADLQKSDLHILYPVLSQANSSRNNLDFSDVVSETTSPCAKAKRGYSSDGTKQLFFEPPEAHKGNVARAIFYFSIRYKMPIPAEEEASLKTWNHQDPPDDFERARNDTIDREQKDRNPFIDYPELADLIADF